jgi:hypothetical protein
LVINESLFIFGITLYKEINMARYVRVPTVVEAVQIPIPTDLGDVGLAGTNDFLIQTLDGTLQLKTETYFNTYFVVTNQSQALTGGDV